MAALSTIDAGRSGRTCTFRIATANGVWHVTRDDVFWGDFLTRESAVRGACEAARTFDASGGASRVLAPPAETVVPHHLTRR